MGIAHGRVELFRDDELVVDLHSLSLVQETLNAIGITFQGPEENARLRLARLPNMAGIPAAINHLRVAHPEIVEELDRYCAARGVELDGAGVSDLDRLLTALRLVFRLRYADWTPPMGKNRTILGYPYIGGGGGGAGVPDPTPAGAPLPARTGDHGRHVRIAQFDTQIFPDAWLAGGYTADPDDVLDPDLGKYLATQGHGTAVASRILTFAPAAQVHLRRVLDDSATSDAWAVATTMADAADQGFDLVNLSLGECATDDGQEPLVLARAVQLLGASSLLVAATGNHGNADEVAPGAKQPGVRSNSPSFPAACPQVIAVGALDAAGRAKAPFSVDAPWVTGMAIGVQVPAAYLAGHVTVAHMDPGTGVVTDTVVDFDGAADVSGTSFAAGTFTGVVAAVMSESGISAREALALLLDSGTPGPGGVQSFRPASAG